MNKNNKILVGVLAFVLVCIVGYSLFLENITITGTATAEGTFNVDVTCQTGVNSNIKSTFLSFGNDLVTDNGYKNDSCSINDNVVSFKTDLDYPTAARNFTFKFQNKGSIPAIFYLKKDGDESVALDNKTYCIYDSTTNAEVSCGSRINGLGSSYINSTEVPVFENTDGSLVSSQSDLAKFIITDGDDQYIKLEPGQSAYMIYGLEWLDRTEQILEDNQYFKFNVTLDLDWQQITTN